VLGLRVSWEKRWITLAPVATILGLAFKMYDPDHLLGDKEEIGITCALVPTEHEGVCIGRRHFPGGAVFMNGPTWGKDGSFRWSGSLAGASLPVRAGACWWSACRLVVAFLCRPCRWPAAR
jgi:alkylation response protein AidB-like acyl-CoA dehydrogenase